MKISLVYGDVGSGHASAAKALKEAFQKVYSERFEVEVTDLYKIADPAPWGDSDASSTAFAQTALLRKMNYFYNIITDFGIGHSLLKKTILHQTLEPYRNFFEQQKPDLIVSIHPYTNITIGKLREQGLKTPYAVVLTDLASVLRGWANPRADLTFSPTPQTTVSLEKLGVNRNQIIESLFPIRLSLQQVVPKEQLFIRHQLDPHRITLIITGGGVSTGALEDAIFLLSQQNFQLIVICGRDKISAKKWRNQYQTNPSIVILDFVDDIQNYFAHADVIITKAGANSLLEIELFEKPAIITHEVGSQEKGNAAYALKNPRFRFLDGDMRKLLPYINELLKLPSQGAPASRRRFVESLEIVKHLAKLIKP